MKLTLANKRIIAIIAVLVILASVLYAVLIPASSVAYATNWGGKDTANLSYYKDGFLDVQGAKAVVDTWDFSRIDKPIVIAVIDTGIDTAHELFDGVLAKNEKGEVLGYNTSGVNPDGSVDISDNSTKHGSEIAGVIAMLIKEFGLEDYIKIYPIKADKGDNNFTIASLTKAVEWAQSNAKVDVINMSLGFPQKNYIQNGASLRNAFEMAVSKASETSVIVAAAGNKQSSADSRNQAFYPASLPNVISVANQGSDGNLYSSSFYHDTTDICAPGQDIYTSKGYDGVKKNSLYGEAKGTSLSAASVSFASALLKLRLKVQARDVDARKIARLVCKMNYPKTVSVSATSTSSAYTFHALNLLTVASANLDDVNLGYSTPTEMTLVHNGTLGEGDYTDMVYMRADAITPVELYVQLAPLGTVDPAIEDSVEWVAQKIKNANDTTVIDEYSLGKGKSVTFVANGGGDYIVKANLPYYNLATYQQVHVEYGKYYVGEVRVTFADRAGDDVSIAPSSATLYTTETTSFALTGVKYLDPNTETKWYVNGEYAASGATFDFTPEKAGTYYITARFGDNSIVDFQYKFTATVKPFILRPLDLSMLIVGLTIALTAIITVVVIVAKKRKPMLIDEPQNDTEE